MPDFLADRTAKILKANDRPSSGFDSGALR
jgi:hypothetical protein